MFPRGTPLSMVVDKMIVTHVHRLALQEKASETNIVDIVTQSNLVNFIEQHSSEFESPWMHRTVAELGLGSERVRRVRHTDTALRGALGTSHFFISVIFSVSLRRCNVRRQHSSSFETRTCRPWRSSTRRTHSSARSPSAI